MHQRLMVREKKGRRRIESFCQLLVVAATDYLIKISCTVKCDDGCMFLFCK